MFMRYVKIRRLFAVLGLGALLVLGGSAQTPQPPAQDQPTFRGGTTLVPVDVRVLDRTGKPITDLTQADFTIFENGVRQDIRHFSTQSYTPETPAAGSAPTPRRAVTDDIAPQNRRVFLIVL